MFTFYTLPDTRVLNLFEELCIMKEHYYTTVHPQPDMFINWFFIWNFHCIMFHQYDQGRHIGLNELTKIEIILFTNPSARAGYDTRSIFKRSLTGFNSEFSFSLTSCLTKAEEPSLSYYLPIAGGRIIEFIPFPRVLVLCEMQSVSSRIWTRVAVFISYDDNNYPTGTSKKNRDYDELCSLQTNTFGKGISSLSPFYE